MNSSLYIGATGLKTHGAGLHTLANNLANVSTVGYKQQSILFEDLMYQGEPCLGSAWPQVFNQRGMGVETGAVRTLFTEGPFEPSNTITDLALSGKGFFEVTKDGKTHYTRAGNFRFDPEGWLKDPNGYTLTGIPIVDGRKSGGLEPIKLNLTEVADGQGGSMSIVQNPPKSTTAVTSIVNLGFRSNGAEDAANPCFSLLGAWNGTADPPLADGSYGYAQPMRVYDANGTAHTATMYFDATSAGSGGESVYEYVVTVPPELDGSAARGTAGAGLLMAGTLTFSSSGELIDMSAFSPGGGDRKNLASWTPSPLVSVKSSTGQSSGGPTIIQPPPGTPQPEGTQPPDSQTSTPAQNVPLYTPQVSLTTADGQSVNFALDLGISGLAGSWSNAPASAADVGSTAGSLPSLGTAARESTATTARGTASNLALFKQDGYTTGSLNGLDITTDGKVVASYTNGQSLELYEIPVFRFRSEDGLYHEGMNHYSYTPDAGAMEYGTAGTENYGSIRASTLEMSNVDMSREMVMMIIMQRGFQMNSKSITTTDTMLQRALELKR